MTVPQAVRTMAVPAVMSQIIVLIYNLADTFFIGRTNNPYMVAGVSLILPLFNVCLAIGSMFGAGGGALLPWQRRHRFPEPEPPRRRSPVLLPLSESEPPPACR